MISSYVIQDWLTISLFFLMSLLAVIHYLYKDRLLKMMSITKENEYFITYINKKAPFISVFHGALFFFQIGVYAVFIYLIKRAYINTDNSFSSFLVIVFVLFLFFIGRYLIGKIVSFVFGIDSVQDILSSVKFTYLSKAAIFLFPLVIILVYISTFNLLLIQISISLTLLLFLFFYGKILLKNQKLIFRNLFYFILYLCALEITPLVYIFKFFYKGL